MYNFKSWSFKRSESAYNPPKRTFELKSNTGNSAQLISVTSPHRRFRNATPNWTNTISSVAALSTSVLRPAGILFSPESFTSYTNGAMAAGRSLTNIWNTRLPHLKQCWTVRPRRHQRSQADRGFGIWYSLTTFLAMSRSVSKDDIWEPSQREYM